MVEDDSRLVRAAQSGDRTALDELTRRFLPLVYTVVRRASIYRSGVEDVVQETFLRAFRGLGGLREPERFKSWLLTIAMREVARRHRADRRNQERSVLVADVDDVFQPVSDHVDETVERLDLDRQRQELAGAVRWLESEHREVMALWWQEVTGQVSRSELADSLGVDRGHAAVRVQRHLARSPGRLRPGGIAS